MNMLKKEVMCYLMLCQITYPNHFPTSIEEAIKLKTLNVMLHHSLGSLHIQMHANNI